MSGPSQVTVKIDGGDQPDTSPHSGARICRESSLDFWKSGSNRAMQQAAVEDPPSKLIGQFLNKQKAAGGELCLDVDLEMDELRPDCSTGSPAPTFPSLENQSFPRSKELKIPPEGHSPTAGNVVDIRPDEQENDDSSSDEDDNRTFKRRSSNVTNTLDLQNIAGGHSGQVLRCTSIQRRVSGLGRMKTKSRLIDPPDVPDRRSQQEEEEDDPLFNEDLPDEYTRNSFDALTIAQWISLVLIVTALVSTLALPKLKKKKLRGLWLWKWEGFVFRLRNKKSSSKLYLVGAILTAWHYMFDKAVETERSNEFLTTMNKVMVCMLVGTLLWLVKTLMVKVLASSFHVSTFFDRIQESLYNQYVIETLSGPPLVEIRSHQEEEDRTMAEIWRLQNAGATLPPELKSPNFQPTKSGKRSSNAGGGLPPRPSKGVSFRVSSQLSKNQDEQGGIPIDKLHKLNHKNVSAWNMKRLMKIVKNGVLTTLDERVLDSSQEDETLTQIRSEYEAISAARKIFRNVAKPRAKLIYLDDLMRFLPEEEALKTLQLVEGSAESEKNQQSISEKLGVKKLHQMVNVIVGALIVLIWLVILEIATSKFLLYISSQVVVFAFLFGNTCRTIFEAIIFVFVMHPFDVGDRCEIDDVQMIVEEMNILTTVFLRFDNQKIIYPNVTLATRPINNYYRSPDMGDAVDFAVHMATPAEKIAVMKQRIISYIDNRSDYWYPGPTIVLMNLENLQILKMSVWLRHRMNHQNMGERWKRRAILVEEMVKIFKELDIEYRLYPLDINIREMPPLHSSRMPPSWASPHATEQHQLFWLRMHQREKRSKESYYTPSPSPPSTHSTHCRMANLSSLVHELRERIAASSSTPPNNQNDEDSAPSFPISSTPTLSLPHLTAKNFPGVFYHGKASAVLPVIGRVLPFFAEPAFRFSVDKCFKYCRFAPIKPSTRNYFRDCWIPAVPAPHRPASERGILVDLTETDRFLAFAASAIKLLSKCLTEGTLYVEGLLDASCVLAVCNLLCHGDDNLHMACFDFARLIGAGKNFEIFPIEKLIRSVTIILSEDVEGVSVYRSAVYDSSLGGCLQSLHSVCPDDVVRSTAADIVHIFPKSMLKTRSFELKAGLCSAYVRIAKSCPPYSWRPECVICMLLSSESTFHLIDCFKVAVSRLGPNFVGRIMTRDDHTGLSESREDSEQECSKVGNEHEGSEVGRKRPIQDIETLETKRQKMDNFSSTTCQDVCKFIYSFSGVQEKEYADFMCTSLNLLLEFLKPPGENSDSLREEVALTAISTLCIVFSELPHSDLSLCIFRQMCKWISWMFEQAEQGVRFPLDVSIFLEAVDSLLHFQGSLPKENRLMIFENTSDIGDLLRPVLKVPWSSGASMIESHPPWKAKYLSIRILSRIGCVGQHGLDLDILDLGLHDEEEEVRIQAVISMPVIVLVSGFGSLMHMFNRLETLKKETKEQVKKFIPLCLGHLACLYGCCNGGAALLEADCKLYLKKDKEKEQLIMDYLLQGFWCSRCESTTAVNYGSCSTVLCPSMQETDFLSSCDYTYLQSLFFELLYDESSEVVQVACVRMIGRILLHGTKYSLLKTRSQWVQCIDFLILHGHKNVRQAFGSQISFFVQEPILECLFFLKDAANKSKEQRFMDKLKHALAAAEDPLVFETLLETAATIMEAVDVHSQLFLFSLILVIGQLDNSHVTVRFIAAKLINRSCYFHHAGGLEALLSKVPHIRNELYNYLCMRLVSQPKMVEEFSAAVLGIETEELVKRMIPVVLPKLVVLQNDSDQALATLYELAKCLNTDMVQLIVNWLPKVLAFALHQADEQELKSALRFYHEHTGSDNQEIFAAALPALLDELICFSDVDDSEEISKRLARVPRMIEEVARILTGSEDLPGFLRNHVVGLLNSIDRKMLHAEDTSLQKQAVRRIEMLIKLMGSHLSTYVPKIMVLLMHAINKAWLQGEGLSVLHLFLKQLAIVSPSSTKHVISQVFAALVPFLERETGSSSSQMNKIVEILEELVVQNKVILKQHIREFPTVPNVPALAEVNKVIQEVRGLMTLKDQLHDVVDGLNHENLNVRYMVASELSKLLNQRTEDFMALFTMEGDSVMDIISSLITSLLKGCAEESRTLVGQRLKLICADCLGAIGAIDPAKMKGFSSMRFKIACSMMI
ncbi:UNVERIFIED_CONTAM: Serine/threonine-protein kinase ATR [Sesamum radiatum]|uniref:Serine/threonine-protein kinase ATR n=1 Tax=Sesamum radiatum TaxID=300843 RepID=A0AAW2RUR3_SESRA